jgi:hypothetical protein
MEIPRKTTINISRTFCPGLEFGYSPAEYESDAIYSVKVNGFQVDGL